MSVTKFIISFILVCAMLKFAVHAEDEMEVNPEDTNANQETQTTNSPPNSNNQEARALEEFIPSEEISVDRPVAFPTDI